MWKTGIQGQTSCSLHEISDELIQTNKAIPINRRAVGPMASKWHPGMLTLQPETMASKVCVIHLCYLQFSELGNQSAKRTISDKRNHVDGTCTLRK